MSITRDARERMAEAASGINWNKAACLKSSDPDVFFSDDDAVQASAVRICTFCAIKPECLAWALVVPERYGVWGGTTEKDRKALTSKRMRVTCPGCGAREIYHDEMHARLEVCRMCGLSWEI